MPKKHKKCLSLSIQKSFSKICMTKKKRKTTSMKLFKNPIVMVVIGFIGGIFLADHIKPIISNATGGKLFADA